MIWFYIGQAFITVLDYLMFFLKDVTSLPFGIDPAINKFGQIVAAFIDLMPWFEVVWNLLTLALYIKFILFAWHWIKYLIGLIRGSSHGPVGSGRMSG